MAQIKPKAKKWMKSVTMWFNLGIFFAPDVVFFLEELLKENVITIPLWVNGVVKLVAIINIMLRLKTRLPVIR